MHNCNCIFEHFKAENGIADRLAGIGGAGAHRHLSESADQTAVRQDERLREDRRERGELALLSTLFVDAADARGQLGHALQVRGTPAESVP